MIPVFREYLALTNQLPLEGVGYVRLRRISAQLDVANRVITSPYQEFYFDHSGHVDANPFLNWLSTRDNLPISVARQQYLTVINHLVADRPAGELLEWRGIGTWKRDTSNKLQFNAEGDTFAAPPSVKAEKVIRENVSHAVQVGESSIDSITMAKNLNQRTSKSFLKSWWGALLFIVIMAILVLILVKGSITPSMFSNPAKVVPTEAASTYRTWQ